MPFNVIYYRNSKFISGTHYSPFYLCFSTWHEFTRRHERCCRSKMRSVRAWALLGAEMESETENGPQPAIILTLGVVLLSLWAVWEQRTWIWQKQPVRPRSRWQLSLKCQRRKKKSHYSTLFSWLNSSLSSLSVCVMLIYVMHLLSSITQWM